jgi:tetratricopeptide (TPR) repeat protein
MKKGIIVIIAFFSLLVIAGAAFADAEYDAAMKAYAERNYRDAAVHFRTYVEKKPDSTAYYLLGYSLYELGKYKEATECFKQAYLIDPTFSPEKVGLSKEFPKVRAKKMKKTRKKAHRHTPSRGHKKAPAGNKPTKAKSPAGEKCPAPPQKSTTRKTP